MSPEKEWTKEQPNGIDYQMLEQIETNIAEKAQEAEKTLNQRILETTEKNKRLENEVKQFASKLNALERLLQKEREKNEINSLRFDDYRLYMERVATQREQEICERDRQLEEYRRQLERFVQEQEEHKKEVATLRQKGERYDHIKKGLDQIRIQAELKAGKLIEEAQGCARDAIDQVNDTVAQLQQVKAEAAAGGEPRENRLEQFYALLDEAVEKITGMREQFFIKNHIPPEPVEAPVEKTSETPLDRMMKVMLGGNENGTETISGGRSDGESG